MLALFRESVAGGAPPPIPIHVRLLLYIGGILWIAAYVFAIMIGLEHHTYGIPLVAICMDLAWEAIYTFYSPPQDKIQQVISLFWFLLDLVVLGQLYSYGRAEIAIPAIQKNFFAVIGGTLLMAFIGQFTFMIFFNDKKTEGVRSAYITNLVISILFVFFFFARQPDLHGLSIGMAWTKMIGTALTAIANLILMAKQGLGKFGFMIYLFVSIFIFDVVYLYLLYHPHAFF